MPQAFAGPVLAEPLSATSALTRPGEPQEPGPGPGPVAGPEFVIVRRLVATVEPAGYRALSRRADRLGSLRHVLEPTVARLPEAPDGQNSEAPTPLLVLEMEMDHRRHRWSLRQQISRPSTARRKSCR